MSPNGTRAKQIRRALDSYFGGGNDAGIESGTGEGGRGVAEP